MQDLQEPDVLDRALRLLLRQRFGQDKLYIRISPYVNYDKLSKGVVESIEKNAKLMDEELQRLRLTAAATSMKYVSSKLTQSVVILITSIEDLAQQLIDAANDKPGMTNGAKGKDVGITASKKIPRGKETSAAKKEDAAKKTCTD